MSKTKFGEFDPATETWTCYIERLDAFFAASEIADAGIKRAVLISNVGAKTYSLMRNLVSPAKPKDKTFTQLVETIESHHHPRPSAIVQRFKFNTCFRQPGQSLAEFVAELRRIAEFCEYGLELENMLRDRLVCGVADDSIQKRLLSEKNLNYKRAFELAQAMETAVKNVSDIQITSNATQKKDATHTVNYTKKTSGATPLKTKPTQKHPRTWGRGGTCYRCGEDTHSAEKCKHADTVCSYCHIKGHIKIACFKRKRHLSQTAHMLTHESENESNDDDEECYSLFKVGEATKPITVQVELNSQPVKMQFDTGASLSIMSETEFKKLMEPGNCPIMKPSTVVLRGYSGKIVNVVGSADVDVTFQNKTINTQIVLAEGDKPSLFGRNWIDQLGITNLCDLHEVSDEGVSSVHEILSRYPDIFGDGCGQLKGMTGKIYIDHNVKPSFFKPRPLPFALKEKVDAELDRLLKEDIISETQHSEWATPIVPVLKSDQSVRLCGDYKVTVNRACHQDTYPIPRIEDLYAKLSNGKTFTKLDLKGAFLQLPLDEESKQYTTINTHRGLFQFNRLPFGITSSPGIFQRCMETLLQGIPMTGVYQDDIIVTGKNAEQHAENLSTVLSKLSAAGVKVKKEKCIFQAPEVIYLGHRISAEGLRPVEKKVEAILNAPAPTNITELKSYLGLLNYYGRFLPNLSTVLAPLHLLLRKDVKWQWKDTQKEAFLTSKQLLHSAKVLVHFDNDKELVLATDASQYGIGAVLSHRLPDGTQRPISFASRTLNQAEKGYSQIEKEGLSVVFGVKKFHQYLYGRKFWITNDHKPLQTLFGENKGVSAVASPRIQRWALTLSAYNYEFLYTPGKEQGHADAMSRLPLSMSPSSVPVVPETILFTEFLESTPVTSTEIRRWTEHDRTLSQVQRHILGGWPQKISDPRLRPYFARRNELSSIDGVILTGSRVVIPEQGRAQLLEVLHQEHPGMVKMKMLSRSYVWWPGLDQDIEEKVRTCDTCQVNSKATPPVNMHPWEYPNSPWQRIHIDYAGPFMGKMFLVIVDPFSKWMDVHVMNTSTSEASIERLQISFSTFGLPKVVVSDNGTCFTSAEFEQFMDSNKIQHILTPPYHPGSNGLAERSVQTLKEGLKKTNGGSIQSKVSRFLFRYRTLPHSTTGKSPAELMYGRRMRTCLDFIYPDQTSKVMRRQACQKTYKDERSIKKAFVGGDRVYVTNFGSGQRYIPGVVRDVNSSICEVELADGRVVRRHFDHVKLRFDSTRVLPDYETPQVTSEQTVEDEETNSPAESSVPAETYIPEPAVPLRRSGRTTKVPERLDL